MTKATYKVGDKVRILDAKNIMYGVKYWGIGDVAKVKLVDSDGDLIVDSTKLKGKSMMIGHSEFKYIEKVEESDAKMTQFEVGDVVKANEKSNGKYSITTQSNGFTGKVVEIRKDGRLDVHTLTRNDSERDTLFTGLEPKYFEVLSPKPTKKQRLTTLEQKVEAMQAEIDTLKATQSIGKSAEAFVKAIEKHTPKSANEQRKAIIDEAKAFVEGAKNRTGGLTNRKGYYYPAKGVQFIADVDFIVNAKKRTVVAILRNQVGGNEISAKAIAKCAPDDVFNADIGKAIALGRALGLNVSKFEKAVQPSEVVVGMKIDDDSDIQTVSELFDLPYDTLFSGKKVSGQAFNTKESLGWLAQSQVTIADDSEAQY